MHASVNRSEWVQTFIQSISVTCPKGEVGDGCAELFSDHQGRIGEGVLVASKVIVRSLEDVTFVLLRTTSEH